jgi:hypothetical protein
MSKYLKKPNCAGHWWFLPEDKLNGSNRPEFWEMISVSNGDLCGLGLNTLRNGVFVKVECPVFDCQYKVNRPLLPKGTVISYDDCIGTVIEDKGEYLMIKGTHDVEKWFWIWDGKECKIVSFPKEVQFPK